eukprot:scpid59085/ scgid1019/ 
MGNAQTSRKLRQDKKSRSSSTSSILEQAMASPLTDDHSCVTPDDGCTESRSGDVHFRDRGEQDNSHAVTGLMCSSSSVASPPRTPIAVELRLRYSNDPGTVTLPSGHELGWRTVDGFVEVFCDNEQSSLTTAPSSASVVQTGAGNAPGPVETSGSCPGSQVALPSATGALRVGVLRHAILQHGSNLYGLCPVCRARGCADLSEILPLAPATVNTSTAANPSNADNKGTVDTKPHGRPSERGGTEDVKVTSVVESPHHLPQSMERRDNAEVPAEHQPQIARLKSSRKITDCFSQRTDRQGMSSDSTLQSHDDARVPGRNSEPEYSRGSGETQKAAEDTGKHLALMHCQHCGKSLLCELSVDTLEKDDMMTTSMKLHPIGFEVDLSEYDIIEKALPEVKSARQRKRGACRRSGDLDYHSSEIGGGVAWFNESEPLWSWQDPHIAVLMCSDPLTYEYLPFLAATIAH